MSEWKEIAGAVAKAGAPILGSVIGGPIGGLAGKAIEVLATVLSVDKDDPEAVAEAATKPENAAALAQAESTVAALIPVWQAELAIAAKAQDAEIERGFGAWQARRNFAHYVAWGLVLASGISTIYAMLAGLGMSVPLSGMFGTAVGLAVTWTAANSGGKAVTDTVKAWKGRD